MCRLQTEGSKDATGPCLLNLAMSYFIRRIPATHPYGAAFGRLNPLHADLSHGITELTCMDALKQRAQDAQELSNRSPQNLNKKAPQALSLRGFCI